jgi:TrmH family RNA methyltransferase
VTGPFRARHSFVLNMTEELTSRKNRIISHIRRLGADRSYRHECGEYVCDGEKLLGEALKWGAEVKTVLWTEPPAFTLPETVRQYRVTRELIEYVSPMKSSPGLIFTAVMKTWPPAPPGRTLVLETLQDPGNLGTIIRTANALSVDTVILTGECADLWNPKTVRAAMGALFRQRVVSLGRGEMRQYLMENGLRLFGAALSDKSEDIRAVSLEKTAVAIGSEGRGLSPELLSLCDGELVIPMNAACESLNAAVAASIIMWELTRQEPEEKCLI